MLRLVFALGISALGNAEAMSEPLNATLVPQPEFPLFNISTWKPSNKFDLIDERDLGTLVPIQTTTTIPLAKEGNREYRAEIWIIICLCFLLCMAMRHVNDFYTGDSVTLVKEGIFNGRYTHRSAIKKRYLTHVERDFDIMFEKLRTAEAEAEHRQLLENERLSRAVEA